MVYKTINDVPSEGKALILEIMQKGAIEQIDGEINLDSSVYKTLIIFARLGIL